MSSIWRPVDFDSLGSTAVQEGDDSVIAGSLESAYSLNWGPKRFGERVKGRPWHFYYK